MNNEDLWKGPIHRAFVESLSDPQLEALWELLLVATFADDEFSLEERRDLVSALRDSDGFRDLRDLGEVSDELERLYLDYETDPTGLLDRISAQLGDDAARRGAFRSAVQMVRSDGLADSEAEFVRHLGELLGLEPEVVEFAISMEDP